MESKSYKWMKLINVVIHVSSSMFAIVLKHKQVFVILCCIETHINNSMKAVFNGFNCGSLWFSKEPHATFQVHVVCCRVTTFVLRCSFLASELRQSQEGVRAQGAFNPATETCRSHVDQKVAAQTGTELQQRNNGNTKPNVEETVNGISNRLKERRRELGLPESIKVGAVHTLTPDKQRALQLFMKLGCGCDYMCRRCLISKWPWRRPACRSVCSTTRVCTGARWGQMTQLCLQDCFDLSSLFLMKPSSSEYQTGADSNEAFLRPISSSQAAAVSFSHFQGHYNHCE